MPFACRPSMIDLVFPFKDTIRWNTTILTSVKSMSKLIPLAEITFMPLFIKSKKGINIRWCHRPPS